MFVALVITLVVYPPSRAYLFPPAPLALVNSKTGGLQAPKAGMLGSHDSMTGAPEKHQGEAVEQEAHNFVSGFTAITISSATGKHPEGDTAEEKGSDSKIPDPSAIATNGMDAKATAAGSNHTKHDKTKQPMEVAMWEKARPVMHGLADIADGWERFGK
jgi:Protein of unknown function (DUF3292)